jgi:hypothetical protein
LHSCENKRKTKAPPETEALEREIRETYSQIGELVYELYGLIDDEIKIMKKRDGRQGALPRRSTNA